MIRLNSITFSYPGLPPIFHNFGWEVRQGESWAIIGPSGCGKTTLLYLLAGIRFPSNGTIEIDDAILSRPRPKTGVILQDYGLLPWATVKQNAELGFRIRNFYGPDGKHAPKEKLIKADVDSWLNRLRINDIANKYPGQISGGQRQRTAIARTLSLKPDLLLMDEPFSSLDAPTRESLQNLTLDIQREQNLTLMIVTHSIEEAAVIGEKILLINAILIWTQSY
jgi:NitT/TauT family transport system ATP-binding protein